MNAHVLSRPILAACLSLAILVPRSGVSQMAKLHEHETARNLDVRTNGPAALPKVTYRSKAQLQTRLQSRSLAAGRAVARLRTLVPGAEANISPVTGAPEIVRSPGSLTLPAPGRTGTEIVRGFLSDHSDLYGLGADDVTALRFIGESVSPGSGLRMVRVEQTVNGRPIFQSETRFTLARDGRIIRSVGLMAADAAASAPPLGGFISAPEALAAAMASVGITVDPAATALANTAADGMKTEIVANQAGITRNVVSEIVYFPAAPGSLVPAWSQITFTNGEGDWYTLVDAWTGAVLWRKNLRAHASTQEARFSVYVQGDGKTPADSPSPLSPTTATPGSGLQPPGIARTTVKMSEVQDLIASPNGWLPDNGASTTGNNVDAYLDRIITPQTEEDEPDAGTLDFNGHPVGNPDGNGRSRDFFGLSPRDFQSGFLPPPQAGNPEAGQTATGSATTALNSFRRGAVTHLFYLTNWYHDQLYQLGFDEASGNFQQVNFSGMGSDNDRVLAEAQDGSGVNNANFSTPPDGQSGRMQMYIFPNPAVDRDGDLDAEIVLHELTHGVSNRLIGNGAGLSWDIGAGMGEGWSDFYALSLLNNTPADNPNATYAMGGYATYKLDPGYTDNYFYGIRRFPYSTDNNVNPMTWADIDQTTNSMGGGTFGQTPLDFNYAGALEVHNVGEIWALTLWEVRGRIIADPNGANGSVPAGNQTMLRLVTDALKMTPLNPSFISARDALFDADAATNNGANEASIWAGFADRGLGYGAYAPTAYVGGFTSGHTGIRESFATPYLDVQNVSIDDSEGNHNGSIDPGEPVKITVQLKNPWRSANKGVASATATLTTATAGVTLLDGSSIYPAIPAQGSASGDSFHIIVPAAAAPGQALKFTITSTSSLGTRAIDFTLRVGVENGTGTPVTYTREIPGGLYIPDYSPGGVTDSLTINDDFEIADVNFRVDLLQHPYVRDVTVMLRAPNGLGNELIAATGYADLSAGDNYGSGDNFIDTVIDDQATGDLIAATVQQAPYAGSWHPAFNSPAWNLAGLPVDPVGQLSLLNGTSTLGVWKVVVSDQVELYDGFLYGWSLIVTPKAYTVTPFSGTGEVSATQTVSGTFLPGNTVTYTVTVTNNGTGTQQDNPGNEFTEVLPSDLTLVSASATSGTAVATVGNNTVGWNGSLMALGGNVTITITATIKPGTGGDTISAQGSIAYDADLNSTNESSGVTDDPGTAASNDPTAFGIPSAALAGTQTVAGTFAIGGSVRYTVVLTNGGAAVLPDSTGDEFAETLPTALALAGATASGGTVVATPENRTITWNGSLAAGASVTITIDATIQPGAGGQTISAQGLLTFDPTLSGGNTAFAVTDDPNVAGTDNSTKFTVGSFGDFALLTGKKEIDIAVLLNDSALGGTLSIVSTTNGQYGTVTFNPDGTLRYTPTGKLPPAGDTFTYTANDGNGGTYTATVKVRDFADAAASFAGNVKPPSATPPAFGNTGIIRARLGKKGTLSASLLLGGKKFTVKGFIDATGVARFGKNRTTELTLERKNLPPLAFSLQLLIDGDLDILEGTLTDGATPLAEFTASRAFYTSKKDPVAPLVNVPTGLIGKYTVIFAPGAAPNQGVDANRFPQGYGFGRITLDKKGTAKLTGNLADGTKVSSAGPLSRANEWPFYVPFARGLGSIGGPGVFQDNLVKISDFDGLGLNWFRLQNTRAKIYRDGWPDGILTDLLGSKFVKPDRALSQSVLPGLSAVSPGGNAEVTLADGGLPAPGLIEFPANVSGKNKVSLLASPEGLKLTIGNTGLIGGSFVHSESGKRSRLQGVIFQKQERGFGYFLGPEESGSLTLAPK